MELEKNMRDYCKMVCCLLPMSEKVRKSRICKYGNTVNGVTSMVQ